MEKAITVKDILRVTEGKLVTGSKNEKESIECNEYCFDSRTLKQGDFYVGIKGESINGGIYFEEALKQGAIGCMIQEIELTNEQKEKWNDKIIIKVDDTVKALGQIASYKRSLYGKDLKVIAITGSVGKTSTKDIVANVVSQTYKTLKTQGNFNNHIGVPMTILQLRDQEALVLEMGMNHKGEISYLTQIAKPDICIITNIGTSHIGNLGSREAILQAKLEILEGCEKKCILINNDNDLLHRWQEENKNNKELQIHTFGIEKPSEIMAEELQPTENGTEFKIKGLEINKKSIRVPIGGNHFVYNALCAAQVGKQLNIEFSKIKEGIETFELTKKRMEITQTKQGAIVINDAYNASFESMKASLEYVGNTYQNNRKIAVLGDMLELGKFSQELHEKTGKEVVKQHIDLLICAGEEAFYIEKAAKEAGMPEENMVYITEKETQKRNQKIKEYLKTKTKKEDVILIKASHSMKFYEIADYDQEESL